jgi:hypothetical protein
MVKDLWRSYESSSNEQYNNPTSSSTTITTATTTINVGGSSKNDDTFSSPLAKPAYSTQISTDSVQSVDGYQWANYNSKQDFLDSHIC